MDEKQRAASSEQHDGAAEAAPSESGQEPEIVDAEVVEDGRRATEGDEAAAWVETDLDALLAERTRERDEHHVRAQGLPNLPRGLVTVHPGHADVEERDLRLDRCGQRHRDHAI